MAAVTASVSSNAWHSAAEQMGARAIGLLQPQHLGHHVGHGGRWPFRVRHTMGLG